MFDAGGWTQGLPCVRQVWYHWVVALILFSSFIHFILRWTLRLRPSCRIFALHMLGSDSIPNTRKKKLSQSPISLSYPSRLWIHFRTQRNFTCDSPVSVFHVVEVTGMLQVFKDLPQILLETNKPKNRRQTTIRFLEKVKSKKTCQSWRTKRSRPSNLRTVWLWHLC